MLLIWLHCYNHKQALAAESAASAIPYIRTFFEIISHLARFYKYSAKRAKGLKAEQLARKSKALIMVMNAFTRWLSHDAVTNAVWRSMLSVLAHAQYDVG
jgi:hypothetical protein